MAVQIQVKRGVLANRPALAAGELYWATDTNNLSIGPTPTVLPTLASPIFTGVPAGPTAAANTNTTQLATTAFVVGQAGTATPIMDGVAAVGTSLLYGRQDHIHPSDTSRAPTASPTFTGTAVIPTATITTLTNPVPTVNLPDGIVSFNSAMQSAVTVAGTPVYVTSSAIALPATLKTGIVVGTTMWWDVVMSKTAAGTGAFNLIIYTGTNGSTADTASVTQSIGTQTAAVDSMRVLVKLTFTAVGASGSFFWSIIPYNKAVTATGFGVVTGPTGVFTGTVSAFNTTTASLRFGLGFTSVTGTPTITVPVVIAQSFNLV